jgi:hypothetical protein
MPWHCAKCKSELPESRNQVLALLAKCGVDAKPLCDDCYKALGPRPKKVFLKKSFSSGVK